MIFDQELTRLEFMWIHAIQQHLLSRVFFEIFVIKFGGHRTPDLRTLKGVNGCALTGHEVYIPEHLRYVP